MGKIVGKKINNNNVMPHNMNETIGLNRQLSRSSLLAHVNDVIVISQAILKFRKFLSLYCIKYWFFLVFAVNR